jgi:hypothetical protein
MAMGLDQLAEIARLATADKPGRRALAAQFVGQGETAHDMPGTEQRRSVGA